MNNIALVSLSLLLATSVGWSAPINPTTFANLLPWDNIANNCRNDGTGLCIRDAGNDPYDGAGHLRVNGINYSASNPSDLTGNTYTGGVASIAGLDVSLQYTAIDTSLLRALAIFTNPGSSAINTTFEFESNSGADTRMQFITSSSGDTAFTTADMWVLVDDNNLTGNDPSTLYVIFGPGAVSSPVAALNTTTYNLSAPQGVRSQFNLSVGAGQTVRYMFFLGLADTAANGTTLAQQFNANPGSALLAGLSQSDLDSIQNFNLKAAANPGAEVPEPSTMALAAVGLLAVLARRRR
jgi:hypothetical protein